MAVPAVPCVQQHSSAGVWAARGAAPAGVVRAGQGIAFLHLDFCVPCPRMLVSARTEQGLVAFPGQSAGGKVFWAETLPRDCPEECVCAAGTLPERLVLEVGCPWGAAGGGGAGK